MNTIICVAMLACVATCAFALVDFPDNTFVMGSPSVVGQPMNGAAFGQPMALPMGMPMGYAGPNAATSSTSGGLSPLLLLVLLTQGSLGGSSSSSSSSNLIQTLVLFSLLGNGGMGI